jgi:hypothetical protein
VAGRPVLSRFGDLAPGSAQPTANPAASSLRCSNRAALGAAGARVLDRELAVAAGKQFGPDGELVDPDLGAQLRDVVDPLLAEVQGSLQPTSQ